MTVTQESYERDQMKDKEYLMRNTFWGRWGGWIIGLLVIVGLIGGGFFLAAGGLGATGYGVSRYRRRRRY